MDAGEIKGTIKLEHGGVLSSMAATVTAVRGGTDTLRSLLAKPFAVAADTSGLRSALDGSIGRAASFAKTITEAAKGTTQLAKSLTETERAVRSLNEQSGEFDRTLRQVGTSSADTVGSLAPLPGATTAVRTAVAGLKSETGSLATTLRRASTATDELGVATTGVSGRIGTLARNVAALPPAAGASAGGLTTLRAATADYGQATIVAATAARELRAALDAVALASVRASRAADAAARSTRSQRTAAAEAAVAETALAVVNNRAAASATTLATAARRATADIVLMRTAAAGGESGQLLAGLEQSTRRLLPLLDGGVPRVQTIWQMVRGFGAGAAEAAPEVGALGSSVLALPGPVSAATGGFSALAIGIGAMSAAAVLVVPPLLGIAATLAVLHSEPVKLAAEMEQTSIAFGVLTGSAANAKAMLKDLQAFADTTPFEFPEIASAAKQLLAMGIASDQVTGTLRMLGDISSGLGQPLGEMAYLFGQIKSQGRAMTQDLNQFAGRGVPIYAELAKVMHTNEVGVRAFAEQGKIGFPQIEAAMRSMTAEGGKFGGMTKLQGQSLQGLESTASDTYAGIKRQIGEVLIKNLDLKNTVSSFSDLMAALGPDIVAVFDHASAALTPFIKEVQAVMRLTSEWTKLCNELDKAAGSAIGDHLLKAIADAIPGLNGIMSIVHGITAAIDKVADALETVNYLFGETAAKNHTAISKDEVAAAMKARGGSASSASSGAADAGIVPAASAGTGTGGSTAGGGGSGGGGSAESDAEKSAEHVRELEAATVVAQLRAAGREYEAQMTALADTYERDLSKARSSDEVRAIQADYRAKTDEANAKQREDRMRTLRESWLKGDQAVAQANIAALKAAGKDLEAQLAEIKARFAPEITKAPTNREKFGLQLQQEQELNEAKARDAEKLAAKKKEADDKAVREKEQQDQKTAEIRGRIAGYQQDAQASALEAAGRKAEAELVRFDGQWAKRLADIKDAQELAAATAAYQAERAAKVQESAAAAGGNAKGPQGSSLAVVPLTIADAQKRVREAAGGSGERELARLDLRDVLGKSLSAAEAARRARLGERFGRDQLPSAFSGAAAALNPARAAAPGTSAAVTPAATIKPVIGIDVPAVTKAVVEAVKPVIRDEINQLARGLRDRNYQAAAGARV